MITFVLILWFVFLAAAFNAVMDATENEPNFNESVFKRLNQRFWLKSVSWQFAYKIGGYKFDAWHLSKTGMVLCITGSLIAAIFFGRWWPGEHVAITLFCLIAGVYAAWNGSFKLFYHIIFKVK